MKQLIYTFLLFTLVEGYSQHSEVGVFGGLSYYNGELNPSTMVVNQLNPVFGLFYRKNLSTRYSLRAGLNYGKLAADDELNSTELSAVRQISFSTNVIDASGTIEFNFLSYQINNYRTSKFSPYVFIGFTVFYVNPEISNEGFFNVPSTSSKIGLAVPFGAGIKFNFIENLGLGIEWTYRKAFTDNIDGLPDLALSGYQLNNSQDNDWYSFLGITLNYKFLTQLDRCPGAIN